MLNLKFQANQNSSLKIMKQEVRTSNCNSKMKKSVLQMELLMNQNARWGSKLATWNRILMLRIWETAVSPCYGISIVYHTFYLEIVIYYLIALTAKCNITRKLKLYFIWTIEVVNMTIEHDFQEGWIKFRLNFLIFFSCRWSCLQYRKMQFHDGWSTWALHSFILFLLDKSWKNYRGQAICANFQIIIYS